MFNSKSFGAKIIAAKEARKKLFDELTLLSETGGIAVVNMNGSLMLLFYFLSCNDPAGLFVAVVVVVVVKHGKVYCS